MPTPRRPDPPCPCGSHATLHQCCGRYLDGLAHAADPQTLMRSRYTAYALGRVDYLLATWHPSTRPDALDFEDAPQPRWIGLQIQRAEALGDEQGLVEFVARYKIGGRAGRMHELSRFVREQGRWLYLSGDVSD